MLVGLPFFGMLLLGIIPGFQLLMLLPWAWLVTPPAIVMGRPLFTWTEVGYQPQSGWAVLAALGFWFAVCLVLAAITAWLARNAPEPVAPEPETRPPPKPVQRELPRSYPPAIEVLVCPACRATNARASTCFRCGALLP